jgi:hypothetical protein
MVALKHAFVDRLPLPSEIAYGELVVVFYGEEGTAALYTKDLLNRIVEVGKGVTSFSELEDVDLTNVRDGSYFILDNGKYRAVNSIGSITTLADVEVASPLDGQYLRYDAVFGSFRNFAPSYALSSLTDVDVIPVTTNATQTQNNHVLYYDAASEKFKTRPRTNLINELADVEITSNSGYTGIISLDRTDGIWKNLPLEIKNDPVPQLSNNLNCNTFGLTNYSYRVVSLVASVNLLTLNYTLGDYFVITGVPSSTVPQCTIDFSQIQPRTNSSIILLIELRQNTNELLFGGLTNVRYENGNAPLLSGAGRTDLLTVNIVNVSGVITSYVTVAALDLAALGQGGIPPTTLSTQVFSPRELYDDFYEKVVCLMNYEDEDVSGKLWQDDKSESEVYEVTGTVVGDRALRTGSLKDYVALGRTEVSFSPSLALSGDFTVELFINFPQDSAFQPPSGNNSYFYLDNGSMFLISNSSTKGGNFTLHSNTYSGFSVTNASRLFKYQGNRYIHIALVREANAIYFYVDGEEVRLNTFSALTWVGNVTIPSFHTEINGNVNSIRITEVARYKNGSAPFAVPNMDFGLVGGASDIIDSQVFDTFRQLDEELEVCMFSS